MKSKDELKTDLAVLREKEADLRQQDFINSCSDDSYFVSGRMSQMLHRIREVESQIIKIERELNQQ